MKGALLFGVLCMVLGATTPQPFSGPDAQRWQQYKANYGKQYESFEEEQRRQEIFLGNLRQIEEHNKRFQRGEVSFDLAVNKFADLTNKEFTSMMNGYRRRYRRPEALVYRRPEGEKLPASVDWREKGAVTPIKNQGQCGSCWAFSATGSLEGQNFLRKGKLVSLSEQNLMDCSEAEGNEGCNGGLMDSAFEYIKRNGGIDTEKSYPYEAEDESCRFKKANIGATVKGYNDIKQNNELDLQSAIAKVGPISVAIDAGEMSFQFYNSGIYYEGGCDPENLDHGVLVVGYGSNSKGDYYIVKNSWGEDWGQKGYILMARNKNNNCGIAAEASYPLV